MNKMLRLSLVLLLITAVTGTVLGVVHTITLEPIRITKEKIRMEALQLTLPGATEFKTLKLGTDPQGSISEINAGSSTEELLGYNFTVSPKGYAGKIEMVVGIGKKGEVQGIKLLAHAETPGLGAEAAAPKFLDQFKNKVVDKFTVTKTPSDGDADIQAISGATITSDAVILGVNEAIDYWNNHFKEEANGNE